MAGKRDKVRMISTAGTGHFYTTDKNKKNTPGEDGILQVRSGRAQARPVQGRQDQVIRKDCWSLPKKPALVAGFFMPDGGAGGCLWVPTLVGTFPPPPVGATLGWHTYPAPR